MDPSFSETPVDIKGYKFFIRTIPGKTFMPNQTTDAIYGAVAVEQGDIGIEFGAGVGPGTVYLALNNALANLYALEVVPEQCALLRENITANKLEHKVEVIQASSLDALANRSPPLKADFLVSDVSGMNDLGKELGWYPPTVPCGGPDGTAHIIPFLEQAPSYLNQNNPKARVYFPVVVNFSDKEKILHAASAHFTSVQQIPAATCNLPLKQVQLEIIKRSKHKVFAPLKEKGTRGSWTLEVYEARNPKE